MSKKWTSFDITVLMLAATLWATQAYAQGIETPTCLSGVTITTRDQLSPQRQQVVHALSHIPQRASVQLFSDYIQQAQHSQRSHDFVLRNHAKVALAAQQISSGAYDQARRTLSKVELDSSAAVRAILLLAESYRLQGLHQQATQWFLRIAERYSSNPAALSGLLLAAQDTAHKGDIGTASAVYARVLEKSLSKLQEIKALSRQDDELYSIITDGRIDNTRDVTSEVIQRVLNNMQTDTLKHYHALIESDKILKCLLAQQDTLRELSLQKSLATFSDDAYLLVFNREKASIHADIEHIQSSLHSLDDDDERIPLLQQQLNEARNALPLVTKRLDELKAHSSDTRNKHKQQIAQLNKQIEHVKDQRGNTQHMISHALKEVLEGLQNDYRNIAGDAQLGRAEMEQLAAFAAR